MDGKDYFRPRGDITTILDLADRDGQDNTYFPIDAEASWFHSGELTEEKDPGKQASITQDAQKRGTMNTVHPTTLSIQEFPHRGPAEWGQRFTFELGTQNAGDLLHFVALQIKLNSWYNDHVINLLSKAEITLDPTQNPENALWTFANSIGTSLIDYAEFIVNDQTIERITGEFIRVIHDVGRDLNETFGIGTDAIGSIPYPYLYPTTVTNTAFNPRRPFPVETGTYLCILPFFFSRTKLKEAFPLLSCNDGNVRIDIKLRPFEQMVRNFVGYRASSMDTPLQKQVIFETTAGLDPFITTTADMAPAFRDVRILVGSSLTMGIMRNNFLRCPFEQMVKLVQPFHFDEPLKYLVSKPNANADTVDIQLPLELNHPVTELLWVFRRKAVRINNEWSNFSPTISFESRPNRRFPPWCKWATLRINGLEVISQDGDWFRKHMGQKHAGGLQSYASHIHGYSFSEYPDAHQPSGSANMSKASSVTLTLKVNVPIATPLHSLPYPCEFDPIEVGGWEVFVFAVYYNWLRFENGLCNRLFST